MTNRKQQNAFRLPNGLTLSENRLLAQINSCYRLTVTPTREHLNDARTLKGRKLATVKMVNRGGAVYLEMTPLVYPT